MLLTNIMTLREYERSFRVQQNHRTLTNNYDYSKCGEIQSLHSSNGKINVNNKIKT
jgi:hypothetical protein